MAEDARPAARCACPICCVAEGPNADTGPPISPRIPGACPIRTSAAQQRNLTAQIANPADLLGPRTMDLAERRAVVFDRYLQGRSTPAEKGQDERFQVKITN